MSCHVSFILSIWRKPEVTKIVDVYHSGETQEYWQIKDNDQDEYKIQTFDQDILTAKGYSQPVPLGSTFLYVFPNWDAYLIVSSI